MAAEPQPRGRAASTRGQEALLPSASAWPATTTWPSRIQAGGLPSCFLDTPPPKPPALYSTFQIPQQSLNLTPETAQIVVKTMPSRHRGFWSTSTNLLPLTATYVTGEILVLSPARAPPGSHLTPHTNSSGLLLPQRLPLNKRGLIPFLRHSSCCGGNCLPAPWKAQPVHGQGGVPGMARSTARTRHVPASARSLTHSAPVCCTPGGSGSSARTGETATRVGPPGHWEGRRMLHRLSSMCKMTTMTVPQKRGQGRCDTLE